jgi:hypothetical protein
MNNTEKKIDLINIDDEQKTFEVLVMGQEAYSELAYIRRHMKYILDEEQTQNADSKKET